MAVDWHDFFSSYRLIDIASDDDLLYQVGYTVGGAPISRAQFGAIIDDMETALAPDADDDCLDLCCGNGLLAYELAKSVRSVVGVDFSETYIKNAKKYRRRPNIRYVHDDVRHIGELLKDAERPISKILMYSALAYFTPADLELFLKSLQPYVSPGARMFLGGVPDENLKFQYYNTWRRRLGYLWKVRCRGQESGIGNWWTRDSMADICRRFGFTCEFREQHSAIHTAHYRFDAVVTFGELPCKRRSSTPDRIQAGFHENGAQMLAVCGGQPAFAEPLHVGRPNIGDRHRLANRLTDILESKWLTNDGPLVREFEGRIADLAGVEHCVAMCNATVALEIAIRAAELSGEVIVPSFSFVATAHALQWQQITPVFCDIDPATHTLDPDQVERMITPRTTGILATHVWGRPANVDALQEIADRRGLTLLFDAAHALGSSYRGQMIGRFGLAEVFSFHATKFINAFEGGAVVTNDEVLARKLRLMRNFGFGDLDRVDYIGTNGKMTEISAAMGLTSLESMSDFLAVNRRNYKTYATELAEARGIKLLRYDDSESNNYQYVVVEVDAQQCGLTRDELVAVLTAENILARRYFYPGCHRMEPYRSLFPHSGLLLPVTERVSERVLVLPTGTAVSEEAVRTICGILRTAIAVAPEIHSMLERQELIPAT